MNKQRIAILVPAGIGVLATFLPWVTMPIVGSVSGASGDGWITLLLFIPAIVITLINDKSQRIEGNLLYGAIIPAGLAGLIGLYYIIDFNSSMSAVTASAGPFGGAIAASVSVGFGLYLVVLAGIAVPVLAYMIKD